MGNPKDEKTVGLLNLVLAVGLLQTGKTDEAASALEAAREANFEAPSNEAEKIHALVRERLQSEP